MQVKEFKVLDMYLVKLLSLIIDTYGNSIYNPSIPKM